MVALVRTYTTYYMQVHVTLFEMTATEQIDIAFSRPLLRSTISNEFISHAVYPDKLVALVNQGHKCESKQVGFSPNSVSKPRHMQTLVTEIVMFRSGVIGLYCAQEILQ